jgi:hypothetical protein
MSYYDAARDYQSAEARARAGGKGVREEQIELPAVLAASDAKSLVHEIIAARSTRRDRLTLRLPPSFAALEPGEHIRLPTDPRTWTVEKCTIEGFVVTAELTPR